KASSTSQTPGPPSGRTKKAVRATLILIPLLGLQYIVMPFRPEQGASWEAIYQIASAVIASCQVGRFIGFQSYYPVLSKKKAGYYQDPISLILREIK
ncbi:hypothetical protein J6590_089516, partial [Homalodisca vitripennis]